MNEVETILPSRYDTSTPTIQDKKDELSRLVQTFNKLLDRIQQVFINQKQFLSNISHELKNPLNVILSQIDDLNKSERSAEEQENSAKVGLWRHDRVERRFFQNHAAIQNQCRWQQHTIWANLQNWRGFVSGKTTVQKPLSKDIARDV